MNVHVLLDYLLQSQVWLLDGCPFSVPLGNVCSRKMREKIKWEEKWKDGKNQGNLNPKQPIIPHLKFFFQIKIKKFIFLREIHVRIGPLKDK